LRLWLTSISEPTTLAWQRGGGTCGPAQAGPTPDSIVFLWIALEALSKPPYGTKEAKQKNDVAWVKMALRKAGLNPANVEPSVGRLAELRAAVVHGGVEEPPLLHEGFRALEQLARLLLRHALEPAPTAGPSPPTRTTCAPRSGSLWPSPTSSRRQSGARATSSIERGPHRSSVVSHLCPSFSHLP
jgi:hypothetical protein